MKAEDLETVAELVLSSSSSVSARSGRRLVRPAAAAAASGAVAVGSPAARSRLKITAIWRMFLRYTSIFVKHTRRLGKKNTFYLAWTSKRFSIFFHSPFLLPKMTSIFIENSIFMQTIVHMSVSWAIALEDSPKSWESWWRPRAAAPEMSPYSDDSSQAVRLHQLLDTWKLKPQLPSKYSSEGPLETVGDGGWILTAAVTDPDSICHRARQQLLRILSAVVTETDSSCHGIWQLLVPVIS